MYFLIYSAIPARGTENYELYAGSQVACWINEKRQLMAKRKAQALIEKHGWNIKKLEEFRPISEENYRDSKNGLEYFKQALIDGEVCVFYTYPRRKKRSKR